MSERHPHVQFRLGELAEPVRARETPGLGANRICQRDLDRYYAVISAELAALELSESEAMLIVDALNGTIAEPAAAQRTMLWAGVADAIALDGLAEKWVVDGDALTTKLRGLSLAGSLAVIDAAERYWAAVGRGESPSPEGVGLTRG